MAALMKRRAISSYVPYFDISNHSPNPSRLGTSALSRDQVAGGPWPTTVDPLKHSRGRVPSSGFSDWSAQQKITKKRSAIKILHPPFQIRVQAGTSDDDGHRESQLIGAVTRPRPTSACSGQLALQKRRGCSGRRRRHAPASVCCVSSEIPACTVRGQKSACCWNL
jgi:hypothetical protein